MSEPQFSKSADKNKDVILEQLRKRLSPGAEVLEIASGTGQHAVHFARAMPDIVWQPSDRNLHEYGLHDMLVEAKLDNLRPPITVDVTRWPDIEKQYGVVYSANCIHVMPHNNLGPYVAGAARALKPGGLMMLYGPFKCGGEFTTESNAQFDGFLRSTYEDGGIRDFEETDALAKANGLEFIDDTAMPANNQFIVWQKAA